MQLIKNEITNIRCINKNDVIKVNPIPEEDYEALLNMYQNHTLYDNSEILGLGSWSIVYGYKNYAIKHFHCVEDEHKQDPSILSLLQEHPVYTKLYFYIPNQMMVCERINGIELCILSTKDITPIPNWMDIIEEALEHTLSKGLTHLDLHDQNIMFDQTGYPRIIDVGEFYENTDMDVEEEYFSIKETLYKLHKCYMQQQNK